MIKSFVNLLVFSSFFVFASCGKKNIYQIESIEINNDCFKDRKRMEAIENKIGTVMLLDKVALIKTSESQRYLVCDLPEKFKIENTLVVFSGVELQIADNERLMGRPLFLKSITLK